MDLVWRTRSCFSDKNLSLECIGKESCLKNKENKRLERIGPRTSTSVDRVFLACILWWKHPFRCNRSFNCKPRSTRGARLPTCLNWDEEMDRSTWVILTYELTNRFRSKPVFSESTWTLRSCSIPNVVVPTVNLIIFEMWTSKKR